MSEGSLAHDTAPSPPPLRLSFIDGRGVVSSAGPRPLGPFLLQALELDIPDLRFPADISGGARHFRHRRCLLRQAAIECSLEKVARWLSDRLGRQSTVAYHDLRLREEGGQVGFEGKATLGAAEADFHGRLLLETRAEGRLRIFVDTFTLYGPFPVAAPLLVLDLLRAAGGQPASWLEAGEDDQAPALASADRERFALRILGCCEAELEPLPLALLHGLAPAGWRLPACEGAELVALDLAGDGLTLRYASSEQERALVSAARSGGGRREEVLLYLGETEAALSAYQLRWRADPQNALYATRLLQLAVALAQRDTETLALAAEIEHALPTLPAVPLAQATVLLRAGESAAACGRFERLADLAAEQGQLRSEVLAARAAGRAALTARARERARQAYERVQQLDPDDAESLQVLGRLYAELGEWSELVRIRERQIAKATNAEARLHGLLALSEVLRVHLGQTAAAQQRYEQVLALDPSNEPALRGLAEACIEADEPARAMLTLDRLAQLVAARDDAATEVPLQLRSAALLEHLGRREEALARLDRVLELRPHHSEALQRASELLLEDGQPHAAAARLHALLEHLQAPEERLQVHRQLAELYLGPLDDLQRCVDQVERGLALDVLDHRVLDLQLAVARRGDDDSALTRALAQRADAEGPGELRAALLLELGECYARAEGHDAQAIETLLAAAEDASDEGHAALRALALLYERLGRPDEALEQWNRVLATAEGANDAQAWEQVAQAHRQRGAWTEACEGLRHALGLLDDDARRRELLEQLEQAYEVLGQQEARRDLLEGELIPLLGRLGQDDALARAFAAVGELREQVGDIDGALSALARAAELAPTDLPLAERQADVHELVGAWDAAQQTLERALSRASTAEDRARLAFRLGQVASQLGREREAVTRYREALSHGLPDDTMELAWRRVVEAQLRRGDPVAAAEAAEEAAQTLEEPVERAERLFEVAQLWLKRAARPDDARRCLHRAVELQPRHRRALDVLESLAQQSSDRQPLIDVLRLKVEAAAELPAIQKALLVRLAETLLEAGQEAAAATANAAALGLDGGYLPALHFAARQAWRVGDRTLAFEHYEALVDVLPDAVGIAPAQKTAMLLESQLRLAELALATDDDRLAEGHLEAALAADPQHRDALRLLDELLARQQRRSELVEVRRRRVQLATADEAPDLLSRQASLLLELDRLDEAAGCYERLLELEPSDDDACQRLEELLRSTGQRAQLLEVLQSRAEQLEQHREGGQTALAIVARAWQHLATLAHEFGEANVAETALARVLKLDDTSLAAHELAVECARRAQDGPRLIERLTRLLDLDPPPEQARPLLRELVALHDRHGELSRAVQVLKRVLRRPWSRATEFDRCGELLQELGRTDEAQEVYEQLRTRSQDEPSDELLACRRLLTLSGSPQGDSRRLETLAWRVLELEPKDEDARAALLAHLEAQKRWPELVTLLRQQLEVVDASGKLALQLRLAAALTRSARSSEAETVLREAAELVEGDALQPLVAATRSLGLEELELDCLTRLLSTVALADDSPGAAADAAIAAGDRARLELRRAELLQRHGDPRAARELLLTLLDAGPDATRIAASRALLEGNDDGPQRMAALRTLTALDGLTPAAQHELRSLLAAAGQHGEAAAVALELLGQQGEDAALREFRWRELAAAGAFRELAREQEQHAGKLDGSARAAGLIAAAKSWGQHGGSIEHAERCLFAAAEANPTGDEVCEAITSLFAALGAWSRGVALLERLADPARSSGRKQQGRLLLAAAELQQRATPAGSEVERLLRAALQRDPAARPILDALVGLQESQGDPLALAGALVARAEVSRTDATPTERGSHDERATDLLRAAALSLQAGEKAQAHEYVERARKLSRSPAILALSADVLVDLGDLPSAEGELLALAAADVDAEQALGRACGLAHLRGDAEAEARYLSELAQRKPGDSTLARRLREAYRAAGDLEGLATSLGRLAEADPQALLELAELRAGPLADLPAAHDAFTRVLADEPTNQRALQGMVDVCQRLDRARELADWLAALRESLAPAARAHRGELALRRATVLAEQLGERESAAAAARQAMEDLRSGERWAAAARLLAHVSDEEQALAALRALLDERRATDDELAELARRARSADDEELAITAYRALLARDIHNSCGDELVGLLRSMDRKAEAAELLAERAAAALSRGDRSRAAELLLDLAHLQEQLGQHERRIATLRQAALASPGRRDVLELLLATAREHGEDVSLVRLLEEQLPNTRGATRLELLEELAGLHERLDQGEQAGLVREELLRLAPDRTDLLLALLRRSLQSRSTGRARALLERANEAGLLDEQELAAASTRLAELELEGGRETAARVLLERAVLLAPTHLPAWSMLERLALQTDDGALLASAYIQLAALGDSSERRRHLLQAAVALEKTPQQGRRQALFEEILTLDAGDSAALDGLEALLRDGADQVALADFLGRRQARSPSVEGLLEIAELEQSLGRNARAESALRRALALRPDDATLLDRLLTLLETRGAWQEASALLESYLEDEGEGRLEAPLQARLAVRQATLLVGWLDDPARATQLLLRARTLDPTLDEAHRALVSLLRRQRSYSEAAAALERYAAATTGPTRGAVLTELAQLRLRHLSDAEGAIAAYEQALLADPAGGAEAAVAAAKLLSRRNEPERGLALLDEAAGSSTKVSADGALWRGRLLIRLERDDEAEDVLLSELERHPTPELRFELGQLFWRAGRAREAAPQLAQAADRLDDPTTAAEAAFACAQALESLALPGEARTRYEQAADRDPALRAAWEALVPLQEDDPPALARSLRALEGLAQAGTDRAAVRARLARVSLRQGQPEHAQRLFELALQEAPNHREALRGVRELAARKTDWGRCAELLRRELALAEGDEERAELHRELGLLLDRRLGDSEGGMAELRLAVSLEPSIDNHGALLATLDRQGAHAEAARVAFGLAAEQQGTTRRQLLLRTATCYERAGEVSAAQAVYAQLLDVEDELAARANERLAVLAGNNEPSGSADWLPERNQTRPFPEAPDALDELTAAQAWPQLVEELQTRSFSARDPGTAARLQLRLADVLEQYLDRPAEANGAYDEAVRLAPDDAEVLERAAEAAFRQQRWSQARELHDRLWQGPSSLPRAELSYRRGVIYEALGYEATANHCYAETVKLQPDHRPALEARARLALYRDDPSAAIEVLLELSQLVGPGEPQRLAELRLALGELYLAQEQPELARERLEATLQLDQHNEKAMRLLLAVYEALGDHAAAAEMVRVLAHQLPDPLVRAGLLHHRAQLLGTHLGDEEEAINCLLKAYDIAPQHVPTLWRLVDYYWGEGDLESVRQMARDLDTSGALEGETHDLRLVSISTAILAGGDEDRAAQLLRSVLADPELHEGALLELAEAVELGVPAIDVAALVRRADYSGGLRREAAAVRKAHPEAAGLDALVDELQL